MCSFDGSTSADSDGTITSTRGARRWDDGVCSTVSHMYVAPAPIPYATITDNAGATGTQSKSVSIANARRRPGRRAHEHPNYLDGYRDNHSAR